MVACEIYFMSKKTYFYVKSLPSPPLASSKYFVFAWWLVAAFIGIFNTDRRISVTKFWGFRWFLLFEATICEYVKPRSTGYVFAVVDSKICNNCATLRYCSPYFGMNYFSFDNMLKDFLSSIALLTSSSHFLIIDWNASFNSSSIMVHVGKFWLDNAGLPSKK